jgi:hypothetical protein
MPSPPTSKWAVPYYVKGLALGIPIYLAAIHMWTWVLIVPGSLATTGFDFRQIYAAAFMVRTGHANELYVYEAQKQFQDTLVSPQKQALPFVSPAYEALLFSPLTYSHFRTAYWAFLSLNVVALGVCVSLLRPWMANICAVFVWLPVAIFLGFLPLAAALIEGQDSVLLTTLMVCAFVLLTRQRSLSAGLVTGLAFFKFPIVLPVAVLFLIWRQWRFMAGFAISSVAVVCVSVWLTGFLQTKVYVEALMSIAGLKPATSGLSLYPVNWRMMANIHGLTVGLADGWISALGLRVLPLLLSVAVLGWTAVRGRRINEASSLLLLAVPCGVLVSHHTYVHDLSVLLLPVIVLLNTFLPSEADGNISKRLIARSAALMFVAPVMESFSPGHFYLVALPVLLLLIGSANAVPQERPWLVKQTL